MIKISSRGREVAEMIARRNPFKTHGALSGDWDRFGTGFLNDAEREVWDRETEEGKTYVVYSYATPIAWYTERHGWHVVSQRFSVTTSKHQGKLYLISDVKPS